LGIVVTGLVKSRGEKDWNNLGT